MHVLFCLLFDGSDYFRMAMSERNCGDPGYKIQISLSPDVVNIAP
jgi:hypothetical protein